MACIYPSQIVNDVRKSVATGSPWVKREIRFPGDIVRPIEHGLSPGTQQVGKIVVPVWCSSCGDELPKDTPVICFWYDAHPGQPTSDPGPNWIHAHRCKHSEGP